VVVWHTHRISCEAGGKGGGAGAAGAAGGGDAARHSGCARERNSARS